jgi:hypothetical protein
MIIKNYQDILMVNDIEGKVQDTMICILTSDLSLLL